MADDVANATGTNTTTRRRGGGQPGTPTDGQGPPSPAKDNPKAPPESGRVARNSKNLLAIPVTRLKLGWYQQMPGDLARFRIWIPTKSGGKLTIRYKTGTVDLRKPFRTIIKKAAAEVTYEVKPGEYGEYFAVASGKAKEWIGCEFVQTAFSRDGTKDSDPPLIPWNFYYWPTSSSRHNPFFKGASDVLAHYAKAFGHDAEGCRKAEEADHGSEEVKRAPFYDWVGHCHMAAPASGLFEEPRTADYNGQFFSSEDMKLLAAEYWGNFGQFGETAWELKRGSSMPGGSTGRYYLPGYFKPGDPDKDKEGFVRGLIQEFRKPEPDPRLPSAAEQVADNYIGAAGGQDEFRKQIDGWFGELAAEFYQALIDYMLVKKQPLMANMRSYRASAGPDQVWNQVYFWYQVHYREHSPEEDGPSKIQSPEDENDMVVLCEMRANVDQWKNGSTTGLPAEIDGNEIKPTDGNSLVFHNKWRIEFDGKGHIKFEDPRNRWYYLRNGDREELYAPTELLPLSTPSPNRNSGGAFHIGNSFLEKDIVEAGLLKIHKRYR